MAESTLLRRRGRAALGLVMLGLTVAFTAGCGSSTGSSGANDVTSTTSPPTEASMDPTEALGPDGCGLEVNDCSLGGATPAPEDVGPAECMTESFQEAVISNIDGGSFMIVDPYCDGSWAAFLVDRSRDSCPAGEGPPPPGCEPGTRADLTFWQSVGGHWQILTFSEAGGCADVRAVAPDFPEAICGPTVP
jgi:hypothetical protein